MSAEVLPRSVGAYPRVVSGLYEEWTRDGSRERERGGVRPTEDKLVHTHTHKGLLTCYITTTNSEKCH